MAQIAQQGRHPDPRYGSRTLQQELAPRRPAFVRSVSHRFVRTLSSLCIHPSAPFAVTSGLEIVQVETMKLSPAKCSLVDHSVMR